MRVGWEPVIGIEVHVQLDTRSKIFSSAPVEFGSAPNQCANLIDFAMPGALPVLNQEVVRMAVRFGLAIDADIAQTCIFDRKNYFYPDLPKGYQISQFEHPIVGRGELIVFADDGSQRRVGITRAHLEEDAGKSVHDRFNQHTGIDLNRAGTPLLEVVTEPDMRSAAEAASCFRQLHSLVTWIGICDGILARGSMRCDANVSVRREGEDTLGERTEIKNINSFRFVERAIDFEIDRQIALLEEGGEIVRETRQYDAGRDQTFPMRGKELSDDYRYFPDPDLLPLKLSEEFLANVRAEMPELPSVKIERYETQLNLPTETAVRLTRSHALASFFEQVVAMDSDAVQVANWLTGDIAAALNNEGKDYDELPLHPSQLADLIHRVGDGTISSKIAKDVFEQIWGSDDKVDEVIEREGLQQVSDVGELTKIAKEVIDNHPEQVQQIREGKTRVFGFLVGQVMKQTQGKADPKQANSLLKELLNI